MKSLRQSMAWLHTWTGLLAGWGLFFIFATGTAGYFAYEIDRWMRPELPLAAPLAVDAPTAVARAQHFLQQHAAGAEYWNIMLPGDRRQVSMSVSWAMPPHPGEVRGRHARQRAVIDPLTARAVPQDAVRATGGGTTLYRMHYLLHYMPESWGIWIVSICTLLAFVALMNGVITHKKIFTDFFTFRPGKRQVSWLDAHNLVSVMALPFFLMITCSGLVFFMYTTMPAGLYTAYGTGEDARGQYLAELSPHADFQIGERVLHPGPRRMPSGTPAPLASLAAIVRDAQHRWPGVKVASLSVNHPADAHATVVVRPNVQTLQGILPEPALHYSATSGARVPAPSVHKDGVRQTYDVLLALHEGRFAGAALRWLYVVSGLLGCAMIATGLVLWAVKREQRHARSRTVSAGARGGFRLVTCLNIGTVAGLPLAIAVYFWANRLLPAYLPGRAHMEVHCLFITWGVMLLYPVFRPARKAWGEVLGLGAAAFGLLPVLNFLTSSRHLGITLPAGDWGLAGFDFAMMGIGLIFAYAAVRVQRHGRHARRGDTVG